jgi:hypothetical protein
MPDCTHGWITDGDHLFGEAFDWMDEHARPTPEGAVAVALKGT